MPLVSVEQCYGATRVRHPLVVSEELLVGQELVNAEVRDVDYRGQAVPLTTGRPRWHALKAESVLAVCGQQETALLPLGLEWTATPPEHAERCAECLRLYPVTDA